MKDKSKNATRRTFLGQIGAAAVLPLLPSLAGSQLELATMPGGKPSNVIFILSDDHRYDCMGFLGKPEFLETPNMDRMAREGAYLEKTFVTTSLCSPSRASILTGQFSHKHGVIDNQTDIPKGTVFFPEYLQKAGYQTAYFGKWHMGHDSDAPRPGFDKWVSFEGQGQYYDGILNIDGAKVQSAGYITDILTDHALQWLERDRDRNKPFFLYLSHKAVHAMFQPAKRHLGKYEDVKIAYPASMADSEENYRGKPRWVKEQRNSWHGVDYMYHGQMDFDTFYKRYLETVLGIDDSVGRMLDFVDAQELRQNTVVMYMGDNGFSFGEHGLIDKRHMYEDSMRVPLLAYAPGLIKAGTVIRQMIQNIDVAPTILELAGLRPPEHMDGQSMLPLLRGEETVWRDAVFYEYYWEWNYPQTPTVHGIRTDRHKYMHYHGIWDIDELYDLERDPDEMHNLIDSPGHQQIVEDLKNRVFAWLQTTEGMQIPLRVPRGSRGADRGPTREGQ
jgi:arylsulfatase A-like enzyme